MLWDNVDKSVIASVGRALCFRFVGETVVILQLQYCSTRRVFGIYSAVVYTMWNCRSGCVLLVLL